MYEMSEEEKAIRDEVSREVWDGEQPVEQEGVEEVVEEKVEEEKPEDPWTGVNPALRQTLESLQSRIADLDTINTRLKQAEKRIGGAEGRLHEIKQSVVAQPTPEQVQKASESNQAWEALKEDFPEYAQALDSVRTELTEKTAELNGKIPDVEKLREAMHGEFESRLDSISKAMEVKLVKMKHRDLDQIKVRDDFKAFIAALPPDKKMKANSWNSEDVIEILDEFKELVEKKKSPAAIAAERKQRLESAAADNRDTRKPTKQKSLDDMTEEELRRHIFEQEFKEK